MKAKSNNSKKDGHMGNRAIAAIVKSGIVLCALLLMSTQRVFSLGYFPPPHFSNYRERSSFWSDQDSAQKTLSSRQIDLVKRTLKELRKAGLDKSEQTKCVQELADSVGLSERKNQGTSETLSESAACCCEASQHELAEQISHCSLNLLDKSSAERLQTLDNLAGLKFRAGDCKEAIGFMNEALEIQRRYSKTRASDTGVLLNHLAQCYAKAGHLKQSKRILEQAIKDDTEVRGADSFAVAEDYYNLGIVQNLDNQRDGAIESVKAALDKISRLSKQDSEPVRVNWQKFYESLQNGHTDK